MIYVLYGQPASGKTTLGELLASHLDTPFIIDGDEFRKMFKNEDYGFAGREKNIRAANAVATYLNKKSNAEGHVVISLVNPYKQFRNELLEDNEGQVVEVLLCSTRELRKEYHVEDFEIGQPHCIVNTDEEVEITWKKLKEKLKL